MECPRLNAAPVVSRAPFSRVASCSGFDNELGDLIVAAGDQVVSPTGKSFVVLKHLGRGTFGQVLKVQSSGNRVYAVKVIRNRPAFLKQAEMEVEVLQRLRIPRTAKGALADTAKQLAADPRALVVQMHDHFVYKNHLCLVFEELGVNLLQLLQQNHCRGLSISLIRYFTKQLLKAKSMVPTCAAPRLLAPTVPSPNARLLVVSAGVAAAVRHANRALRYQAGEYIAAEPPLSRNQID